MSRPRLLRAAAGGGTSANGRLNVAFIGTANQAGSDFEQIVASKKVKVVAMCDIDDNFLDAALDKPTAQDAKRYNDYRKMLDEMGKDIDACIVAIPDHSHFHAAYHVLQAGKHLYCEKPLCHDIWEVRKLTETAKEKGLVTQMGTQIHGGDNYRRVVEKIQAGAIGKGSRGDVWGSGGQVGERLENPPVPVPKNVHWDLWLGPAAEHQYSPKIHPFNWRGYWDFGGG